MHFDEHFLWLLSVLLWIADHLSSVVLAVVFFGGLYWLMKEMP